MDFGCTGEIDVDTLASEIGYLRISPDHFGKAAAMHDLDKKIMADTSKRLDELLNENEVWDFGAYGWRSGEDIDPDFFGHAMWQSNLPLGWNYWLGMNDRSVPRPTFPAWKQFLAVSGADFEGLMVAAARLSIGLALFHRQAADERPISTDNFLQLHLMGAIVALGSASDRIRDVFVATAFNQETKDYSLKRLNESNSDRRLRGSYRGPFDDAFGRLGARADVRVDVVAALKELPLIAERVQRYRDERNHIVHVIATELGRQERRSIDQSTEHKSRREVEDEERVAVVKSTHTITAVLKERIADDTARPIA